MFTSGNNLNGVSMRHTVCNIQYVLFTLHGKNRDPQLMVWMWMNLMVILIWCYNEGSDRTPSKISMDFLQGEPFENF